MEHKLPPLPYALDALEPYMSAETLQFHYGKHHKTYVKTLNELVQDSEFGNDELVAIVRKATGPIFNNAAQVWNHTFFWNCMVPDGGGTPSGSLAAAIKKKWGGYKGFKEDFLASATENFGSGWTWLVKKTDNSLDIVNTSNAGTPLTTLDAPLLTLDVWEHAYYIDHRNERKKFVSAFMDALINWKFVQSNYEGDGAA